MAMAQSRRLSGALFRGFSLFFKPQPPRHGGLMASSCISSRGFGSTKLFVGGLSFRTGEESLRNAFAAHGEVSDVRIISDRETGRSRGFGFVTFLSESDAETAVSKMDGQILDERVIRVDRATSRAPAPRPLGSASLDGPSRSSSGPPFDSSLPAEDVDWGSIPSLHADLPQNVSANSGVGMEVGLSSVKESSGSRDSELEKPLESIKVKNIKWIFDLPNANNNSQSSTKEESSSTTVIDVPPADNQADSALPEGRIESSTDAFASESKDGPAASSNSGFDINSFPSFDDIDFEDGKRLPKPKPKFRLPLPSRNSFLSSKQAGSPFRGNSELDTGIPKPTGPEFDFGLSGIGNTPPPTETGSRPQGGFDINIPPGSLRHATPGTPPLSRPLGFSIFPPKIIYNPDFPYDTPEADNWSEIASDPPKLYLSSLYSPLRSFVSKDKELHWDPFDFDEDAKLPPEPEASVAS